MSKRTSILKKLMIITTVMTMTLGGSMTAFAAEGGVCTCDEQATVVVTVDEQAATENEKEILDLFIDNVQRFEMNEILSNTLEVIGHYYNNDEIRNRIKDMGIFFEIPENETE